MRLFSRNLALLVLSLLLSSIGEVFVQKPLLAAPSATEKLNEQNRRADILLQESIEKYTEGEYEDSLLLLAAALNIYQKAENKNGEKESLLHLSFVHSALGDNDKFFYYSEQSLLIARELNDSKTEHRLLRLIGNKYRWLAKYAKAIDYHEQALEVGYSLFDESDTSTFHFLTTIWRELQANYLALGDQPKADQYKHLANVYLDKSLDSGSTERRRTIYQDAQELLREARRTRDLDDEIIALSALASRYRLAREYRTSISYYKELLKLYRRKSNFRDEAEVFFELAKAHKNIEEDTTSTIYFKKSLEISLSNGLHLKEYGDSYIPLGAIQALGEIYAAHNPSKAIDYYNYGIEMAKNGHPSIRRFEESFWTLLGDFYASLKNYDQAIRAYQNILSIRVRTRNRAGEPLTLAHIADLANLKEQPELAITFYKQAVNVYESIRSELVVLPTEQQITYAQNIAGTYRALADLLLQQGRIPEAQQTLDLLKLEELREFTNTRATWTGSELQYTDLEQPIIDAHTDLIAFGQTLEDCKRNTCDQLETLLQQSAALTAQYNDQVQTFNDAVRDNRHDDDIFQNPDNLSGDAQDLLAANPDSVLIYPFITKEKLWLLYATPGSVGTIEVPVSQQELAQTVQQFGAQLQSGNNLAALQASSQQLHSWLIQPLEAALQQNQIQHLIFVNDRVTRYIPMAALFDGQQYLLERYTVSSVIAPGVTDTEATLGAVNESNVLGLGLTRAVPGFGPLPAVATELDNVVRSDADDPSGIYPGQVHLDEAFTREQLEKNLLRHNVLHIATHAAFVPGRAKESYIVLGDGDRLAVPEIDAMHERLSNLHLVVLSACQTALGGEAKDGTEIAGLSAYFLKAGRAESVIASLWAVNDDSTSLLMQRFYELLASGELTKAEALRQAQLSLLYDESAEERLAAVRASVVVAGSDRSRDRTDPKHPFHWAPFILIGNGL